MLAVIRMLFILLSHEITNNKVHVSCNLVLKVAWLSNCSCLLVTNMQVLSETNQFFLTAAFDFKSWQHQYKIERCQTPLQKQ